MKKGIVFLGSGFELVGMVLAALFVGSKLDDYLGTSGVYVGVCLLLFMAVWTFHFVVLLKRYMADLEKEEEEQAKSDDQDLLH